MCDSSFQRCRWLHNYCFTYKIIEQIYRMIFMIVGWYSYVIEWCCKAEMCRSFSIYKLNILSQHTAIVNFVVYRNIDTTQWHICIHTIITTYICIHHEYHSYIMFLEQLLMFHVTPSLYYLVSWVHCDRSSKPETLS